LKSCENCTTLHDGTYGSGRFCSIGCARGFATKASRLKINQEVSAKLKGKPVRNRSPHSKEVKEKIRRSINRGFQIKFQKWIDDWLSGKIHPTRANYRVVHKALAILRGDKCEQCGWKEVHPKTGLIPVQLHHIDGDGDNNSPDNVKLLCPSCHSLTLNFMALNYYNKLSKITPLFA
jgi:hypothetical protein